MEAQVAGYTEGASGIMVEPQRVVGNGYIFALAVTGARTLGKTAGDSGPEHRFLPVHHSHDVGADVGVALHPRLHP